MRPRLLCLKRVFIYLVLFFSSAKGYSSAIKSLLRVICTQTSGKLKSLRMMNLLCRTVTLSNSQIINMGRSWIWLTTWTSRKDGRYQIKSYWQSSIRWNLKTKYRTPQRPTMLQSNRLSAGSQISILIIYNCSGLPRSTKILLVTLRSTRLINL